MSVVSKTLEELYRQYRPVNGAGRVKRIQKRLVLSIGVVALAHPGFVMAEPVNIVLPAQPLADALVQFAKKTGTSVVVDSALVAGKKAPSIDGYWEPKEGLRRLLAGSGLHAVMEGDTVLIRKGEPPKKNELVTDTVDVRASRFQQIGPMPGLSLSKEEIPGNVQSLSAKEIKDSHATSMAELMNGQLQSVNVNDYQGNPFQMDITYRGFTASPQIGTPQGLSVFMDGIRVNEPFGDIVNWDMIPMSALAGLDVFPGSNPIFGLNTLGGAIAVRTKNGFDNPGTDVEVLTGAFGRSQATLSTGGSKGDVAWYFSANKFKESGWRNNSPSEVNQVFGKLSYRNDFFNIDGSMLYASNNLIGNGLIPIEMYQQDSSSVFTSPDQTQNRLLQFQVAGAFQVNDTFSITGQTYNRKSDRTSVTGDINRNFAEYRGNATRRPAAGETPVCAYASTNAYGIPDYYILDESILGPGNGSVFNDEQLFGISNSIEDYVLAHSPTLNSAMVTTLGGPDAVGQANFDAMMANATAMQANMFHGGPNTQTYSYLPGDPLSGPDNNLDGQPDWIGGLYYEDGAGVRHYIANAAALNGVANAWDPTLLPYTSQCGQNGIDTTNSYLDLNTGQLQVRSAGNAIPRNGAYLDNGTPSQYGTGAGYIDGTPTSIITRTQINQITKGGSIQFNFDLEQHKFMVGASLDRSTDTYTSSQMLGLLTANRTAYLAPNQIGAEFSGAQVGVSTNDFSGNSDTRSVYFSDTFNATDTLHFSFSSRYNYTKVSSTIAARHRNATTDLMDYQSGYLAYLLCAGGTLASCDQDLLNNPVLDYRLLNGALLDPPETEAFTYHKLNPALGVSWSPQNNLNVYANWNQGTRTPSAVELGCAYDDTIVTVTTVHGTTTGPRSLVSGHNCSLPTALSGDPYLPQVVARTTELGARGKLANGWDWNASVYNTNLTDDIYFVAFTSTQSFFDTVGSTRRRGIEFGLSGKEDKWDFKFNYALTDATFESTAVIANADNSSVNHNADASAAVRDKMTISPGNRIPGIPLHNVNLNVGYQLTENWRIGLTMVAHGSSYARGNENNQHQAGVQPFVVTDNSGHFQTITRNYLGDGKTPGYAVFNLNTSYDFGGGWLANLAITNLLDKEYYSASRLDINPFVTGQYGVTDASGFNFNSRDWNSTTFVGPGAPRAAWFTLKYDFDADKR